MNLFLTWLFTAFAVMGGAYLLPSASVDSFGVALIVAAVMGLVSITIKPVLKLLTFPINVLTLGLFGLILNGLLIMLVDYLVSGFEVGGLISSLLMSLVMSLIVVILNALFKEE